MVADTAETVLASSVAIITDAVTKKREVFRAVVAAQNDTITLSDLSAIAGAALLKESDGTAVSCTVSTTAPVITVTQAGMSSTPVVGIAIGT